MITDADKRLHREQLRTELKKYPMDKIASAGKLEVGQVAAFMDGSHTVVSKVVYLQLMNALLVLASQSDDSCDCPGCTLRRTGKLPDGIAVLELRIRKAESAEKPKQEPEPEPKPEPRVVGAWEKWVTHPAAKPTIHLAYMTLIVVLLWRML